MITSNSSADFSDLDAINSLGGNISNVMMVKCTAGSVGVKISMDQGANPDAGSTCDAPLRRMKSEHGDYIPYTLRAKTVSSNPWSDIGCGASNHVEMPTFTSSLDPAPVWRHFGWAPGQDLKIGTYVDTVGVTVTF